MSWKELEESIENTTIVIKQFKPTFPTYMGDVVEVNQSVIFAVTDLQDKLGSCLGMAKAKYPEHAEKLKELEKEATDQFRILYGVAKRNWINYLSIVNIGLQKVAQIKEYVKTVEKLILPEVHDSVPVEIANDYIEAVRCFSVEAYNATAVMCRRAVETAAILLGADLDLNLYQKIIYLKDRGLHNSLVQLATQIRLLGNVPAAHRDRQQFLRNVSREECQTLLDFLEEFLQSLYIRPAKIRELQKRRG